MTIDEMIAVLQAAKAGKQIQWQGKGSSIPWQDVTLPSWSFDDLNYRVKPEPREFRLYPCDSEPSARNGYWFGHARTTEASAKFYGEGIKVREVLAC